MADATNTSTGGGPFVGRDVSAGHDFTGRDKYGDGTGNNSRVDIHTDSPRAGDVPVYEILQNLQRAVLGDQYNLGQPGMLKSMAALTESMAAFHAWRTAADVERANLSRDVRRYQDRTEFRLDTTDSRLSQFMVIVWVTLSVVGVEAVALIWLFVRLSVLGI